MPRRRRRDRDLLRSIPAPSGAAGRRASARCSDARRTRRHAAPAHADDRASRGAQGVREVARPRPADPQRTPRARRRAGARGSRRRRRLRGRTCSTRTPRREIFRLGARRIVASVELTTDEMRAARRAVGWRRVRRVPLWPPRRDDDRALRAVGGVRSRADDVPRSLRAEAHQRRADRSDRLHVPRRHRLGVPEPAVAFASGRRRRSSCRSCGASGIRGYQLVFNVAGRRRRARSSRGYRARARCARDGTRRRTSTRCARCSARSSRAGTSRARSNAIRRCVESMTRVCDRSMRTLIA